MYQIRLVSDANQNRSISTQFPNYVNMRVRVTDRRGTTTDAAGNLIPDFSNPDYYVVGLEPTAAGEPRGVFSVLENGVEVKVEAGLRVVPLQAKNAVKRLIARPATDEEIAAGFASGAIG
ncbi:MAG: hypothetical protein E4H09_01085 [Spirochaetales bacterium]|nr:MAG: hypothetical protein E4H09_01085 [Spirochaetales bacterium]